MTTPDTMAAPHLIRDAWDRIASSFDEYTTPLNFSLGEHALEKAGLQSEMKFLDIGAGSGALAITAARRGAQVLATDLAPAMVARLQERARRDGLANVTTRVMDGTSLDLEDDTFDLTASQHGVSLFPDVKRGLREMVRVTRPGGRAMIVAFGPVPLAEFLTFFMAAMKATVPGFEGLPTDPPPLPFQLADPEKLRRMLADAGLSNVSVDTVDWPVEFRSGSHLWDVVTSSNPIAVGLVSRLTDDQTLEVQRVLDGMLRERSGGGPAVLHNRINIGIGTK